MEIDEALPQGALAEHAARAASAARVVFAQAMFLVAATAGFAGAGAYIGRDLSRGAAIGCWIASLLAVIGLNVARKRPPIAMSLLFVMGLLLGLAIGPTMAIYASLPNGPTTIATAAGATALFVGALGTYGYATRRDFSAWARRLLWAIMGLLGVGIVLMFVSLPHGAMIWSVLGLGVFGAFTLFDFNRLRRSGEDQVVLIAASIFLDVFNVFLFMLQLMAGSRD